MMKNRLEELDSLRGLAALTVLIGHFIGVFTLIQIDTSDLGFSNTINLLKYSPLHIIYAGHEAVIVFLVLSGFVLALPYIKGKQSTYQEFIIKRICRIYCPYLIMICFAIFAKAVFQNGDGFVGLSNWVNSKWSDPITFHSILKHIFLIGSSDYATGLNPVIWSLTHEMRISLIFPILIVLILKLDWKINVVACFSLSYLGWKIHSILEIFNITNLFDYFDTIKYIPEFILGILIAKHLDIIMDFYTKKLKRLSHILFIIIAVLFYTNSWLLPNLGILLNISILYNPIFNEWITFVGAIMFIVLSISSNKVSSLLKKPIPLFLGKISYSLYLYHLVILLMMLNSLYGLVPIWSILLISFFLSIIISFISYKFIEKPSILLGRKLESVIANKNKQSNTLIKQDISN